MRIRICPLRLVYFWCTFGSTQPARVAPTRRAARTQDAGRTASRARQDAPGAAGRKPASWCTIGVGLVLMGAPRRPQGNGYKCTLLPVFACIDPLCRLLPKYPRDDTAHAPRGLRCRRWPAPGPKEKPPIGRRSRALRLWGRGVATGVASVERRGLGQQMIHIRLAL